MPVEEFEEKCSKKKNIIIGSSRSDQNASFSNVDKGVSDKSVI